MKRIQRFYGQLFSFLQQWKNYAENVIILLLLLLWVPLLVQQLVGFELFAAGMSKQPLPDWLTQGVTGLIPILETVLIIALIIKPFRYVGYVLSAFILVPFSLYIILALFGKYGKLPCDCGLLFPALGWKQHLWFNLFFIGMAVTGYCINRRLQRSDRSRQMVVEGEPA